MLFIGVYPPAVIFRVGHKCASGMRVFDMPQEQDTEINELK